MPIERYSIGIDIVVANIAPGQAYAELLASAAAPISVHELTVTSATGNGAVLALSRSAVVGTAAATGVATGAVPHRGVATVPTGAQIRIAWSSSGLAPTGFVSKIRNDILPLATGSVRTLWDSTLDGPFHVEPGTSLLLLNGGSGIDANALKVQLTYSDGRL